MRNEIRLNGKDRDSFTMVGLGFHCKRGTISTHHHILTRMAGGYSGSIDSALQWINMLPSSPGADFVFQSTAYNDIALHGNRSVYAITLAGGTSFAGGAYETMRMQRPALMILR